MRKSNQKIPEGERKVRSVRDDAVRSLGMVFLYNLAATYPEREIARGSWDHARWDETANFLARYLGYPSTDAFLEGCGYAITGSAGEGWNGMDADGEGFEVDGEGSDADGTGFDAVSAGASAENAGAALPAQPFELPQRSLKERFGRLLRRGRQECRKRPILIPMILLAAMLLLSGVLLEVFVLIARCVVAAVA